MVLVVMVMVVMVMAVMVVIYKKGGDKRVCSMRNMLHFVNGYHAWRYMVTLP